jgi:hypothetical protein
MPPHGPMHIRHTPTPLAPLFYIYHRLVGVPRHSLADNLHGNTHSACRLVRLPNM